MCCCGQSRPVAISQAGTPAPARVLFEYRGGDGLVVHGRVTGVRYHFPGPTARVSVDGRDAPYLQVVRGLEAVGPAP
jgi:hypothetical protein